MNKTEAPRHRIEVRLTDAEWRLIAAASQRMGLTMAGLLRMSALGEVERRRRLAEGEWIEIAAREVT